MNGVIDAPHRLACTNEVLKPAGLDRQLTRSLTFGFFDSAAKRVHQRYAQFGNIHGVAKMGVGACVQRLLLNSPRPCTAHRQESESLIQPAQFVEDLQAAIRFFSLRVDVQHHC